jgi:hypothetical protein
MKKFEEGDLFINRIKAYPKIRIFAYSGTIYINNTAETNLKLNEFLAVVPPAGVITTEDEILLITEDEQYIVIE